MIVNEGDGECELCYVAQNSSEDKLTPISPQRQAFPVYKMHHEICTSNGLDPTTPHQRLTGIETLRHRTSNRSFLIEANQDAGAGEKTVRRPEIFRRFSICRACIEERVFLEGSLG